RHTMGRGVQDLVLRKSHWCGWRDSNSHTSRYWNLNPARLPIPPHPRCGTLLRFDLGKISTISGRSARVLHSLDVLLQAIERLVHLQTVGIDGLNGLLQVDHAVAQ